MFTLCVFLFSSATAVLPIDAKCGMASKKEVDEAVALCREADKDPLMTCESQRMGALKWFIRVRKLEGT